MQSYTRDGLIKFTELLGSKGLANTNTAGAMKVAVSRILSDLSPEEEADVRKVDVPTAIRRYNNKNPNALSPKSLAEYQRRVATAIREFVRYVDNPPGYTAIGREPKTGKSDNGERSVSRKKQAPERRPADTPTVPPVSASSGLSLAFPLRSDFLAQVVVPRDLKTDEAKRLAAFIATLAIDYSTN